MHYKKLIVTAVLLCSPRGFTQDTQAPKPAEEVYKNIQVMKGVPAPRLMNAMQFFNKWLGVECNYCHVSNEFDKDDKAAKNTTRKMLTMVHQINGDNFPNNQIVSCWMCHRGSAKPEAFPK
jgi:Photosynthetic reaction centre cytochrome C subunit